MTVLIKVKCKSLVRYGGHGICVYALRVRCAAAISLSFCLRVLQMVQATFEALDQSLAA
jgi:hypothetical protein